MISSHTLWKPSPRYLTGAAAGSLKLQYRSWWTSRERQDLGTVRPASAQGAV